MRLKKEIKATSLSVGIPENILQSMRITFSPWLMDEKLKGVIEDVIEMALKSSLGKPLETHRKRYRRSILQGALNFRG